MKSLAVKLDAAKVWQSLHWCDLLTFFFTIHKKPVKQICSYRSSDEYILILSFNSGQKVLASMLLATNRLKLVQSMVSCYEPMETPIRAMGSRFMPPLRIQQTRWIIERRPYTTTSQLPRSQQPL